MLVDGFELVDSDEETILFWLLLLWLFLLMEEKEEEEVEKEEDKVVERFDLVLRTTAEGCFLIRGFPRWDKVHNNNATATPNKAVDKARNQDSIRKSLEICPVP